MIFEGNLKMHMKVCETFIAVICLIKHWYIICDAVLNTKVISTKDNLLDIVNYY